MNDSHQYYNSTETYDRFQKRHTLMDNSADCTDNHTSNSSKCKPTIFFASEISFPTNRRSQSSVSEQLKNKSCISIANCRRRSTTRIYRQKLPSKLGQRKSVGEQCFNSVAENINGPNYYNLANNRTSVNRKNSYQHPELPRRKSLGSESEYRHRCLYCRCWYDVNNNPVGCCSEAPDSLDNLIKKLTCYPLAQAVVYHCCRENDEVEAKIGRYGNGYNIFSYGSVHVSMLKRIKRWLLLVLLTLFAPCLCCYLPAKGIYRCCRPKRGCHCPSGQLVRCTETTSCSLKRRKSLQLF